MENSVKKAKFLKKISIISTFGGLLFGYDTGVLNGALTYMTRPDQLNLNPLTEGLVTSSLTFGAALGAIFGGRLSDKYGRKSIMKILALVFLVSTLGCAFSPNSSVIIAFRFLLGLAVGGASVIVPTFLAEIAPTEKRGSLVSQQDLAVVIGQLLAYVFNAILGNIFDNPGIWRYMIAIASTPAVALWFGMFLVPETPRWLAAKGKTAKALEILKEIRDESRAEQELKEIQDNIDKEKHLDKATFKDLNVSWIRRLVIIGIGLGIAQQIAGVNIMMYYGTTVLEQSGFGLKTALIANVANGLISVIASYVYMHYLANKVNRRTMLLVGFGASSLSLLAMSIFTNVLAGTAILPFLVVALTMTYLAFFQGSIGPVVWLLFSEIFPLRVRGLGVGISALFLWLGTFVVGFIFPTLLAAFGLSGSFIIFAVCSFIDLLFTYKFVPETRGKSLEEIEEHFRNEHVA